MHAVRHLLAQRHLAVLICAGALLLKLLVPTGYMVVSESGSLAVVVCSSTAPWAEPGPMAMPEVHGDMVAHGRMDHGKSEDHGKAEMPCAFAGLSAAALGAIDPIQLATLIAFVLAVGITASALPPPARAGYLRPPLRGPPAHL